MAQIPDISPFLKAGAVGVMAFVICVLVGVIIFLIKNQGTLRPKEMVREPTSGEKPPDYWEKVFEDIATDSNKTLLLALRDDHRVVMETLGKIRARVRDSDSAALLAAVREFRVKYDRDTIELVKLLRKIEIGREE